MATDVVISGFGVRDIYFRYRATSGVEMFYLQYMGVAVVISFVRVLEAEIPLGVILPPPLGGNQRV